ncbi:MAG: type II secretion system major pseudopilin GspG [Sedimentisphaerales bacterium]|nr:type II secretion system major pseudopilin GspG [Sedimentisphaerales bacterium]
MKLNRTGFTIVEVLVVILLISMLAVFMVPRYLERAEMAKGKSAKPKIAILEVNLGMFMTDCGRYPTQSEGLEALQSAPAGLSEKWRGPYGKHDDLLDPWGNQFIYVYPGTKNPNTFDIISYGKDGQIGGEDENADIYND